MRTRFLGVVLLLTLLVSLFKDGTSAAQAPIATAILPATAVVTGEPIETAIPVTSIPTRIIPSLTPTRVVPTPTREGPTATPTRVVATATPTRVGPTATPTRVVPPTATPTRITPSITPTPGTPPDCGPMDVVFLIDDTGSMGGAIANVKAGISSIINDVIAASGGDYQLGLVSFKDSIAVYNGLAPGNAAAVSANVQTLFASAGGNEPEASDEALNTAINTLPASGRPQNANFTGVWRAAATKIIVLVTDARPGGFDDNYVAGVDDVNAHARALQAQAKGILISAVYVPTGGVNPVIQTVMQDYATTTGGVYKLTAGDGTGTADAIRDILASCGGRSDVYIKDHPSDVGTEPHSLDPIWNSPDIKVCRSASGCASTENPVVGAVNYIFVTLRNNGPNVTPPRTSLGSLYVYSTRAGGAAVWPTSWTQLDVATNIALAPNEVRTIRLTWNLTSGTGHYCLLARWVAPSDPMTYGETGDTLRNTRYNNNIAWKNVDAVSLPPGSSVTRPFAVRNTWAGEVPTDLLFTVPADFLNQGTLVVDLGQRLGEQWLAAGQQGTGIRPLGGTKVQIISPTDARIAGLTLGAGADESINLVFTANPGASAGTFAVQVRQFSPNPVEPTATPIATPVKTPVVTAIATNIATTAVAATSIASDATDLRNAGSGQVGAAAPSLQLVDVGGVEYSVTIP